MPFCIKKELSFLLIEVYLILGRNFWAVIFPYNKFLGYTCSVLEAVF